ncbi:MAG: GAF domain-containing sensor histidine kinase [Patescibacteria group bacterium]|jgi:signal transduction histidine kinase
MPLKVIEDIYKSSLKFVNNLTPEEAFSTIVNEAIKLVGAKYGVIFLVNEEGNLYKAYSSDSRNAVGYPRKRGFAFKAYRTRQLIVLNKSNFRKSHKKLLEIGIRSLILVPLSYNRDSIGVLALLAEDERHFTNEKIKALRLYGSMASLVIRKTQLYSEMDETLKAKDLLIALMAHELKTPLTSINLQVQMLDSGKNKKLHPVIIKNLVREAKRLSQLVEQFVEVDEIKTGNLRYEWAECSLRKIVDEATEYFKIKHPHHSLVVTDNLPNGDTVVGDFSKLLQVFINLLNNSAKFSKPKDKIIISLDQIGQEFTINVIDKGKGIPKKDIGKIFERFYQASNSNKEGLGLGLFLVKKIVEKHGGSVSVRSKINQGSNFVVNLPNILTNDST